MNPQPSLSVPRIMWLALLVSQVIYAVLLNVPGLMETAPQPPPAAMRYGFAAFALMAAIASFVVPSFLWSAALKRSPYGGAQDTSRGHDDVALKHGMRLGMTPFILGLALNEAVAIFGLILGILGEPWPFTTPFFAAALVLMFIRFPTERTFVGPLQQSRFRHHG